MVSIKELPYIAKVGIVTLTILLVAAGVYFLELVPMSKANAADKLTLKSKEAEIAQLSPYKAKLADLTAQADALKAQMEEQRKVVPEEKEVPTFITLVANESAAAGVEVRRYTPKDTSTKEYYVEVPFEVDVDGPYFAVRDFYDRVQKLQRIVNVSKLQMAALKGGRVPTKKAYKWSPNETVGASCVLTTFYSSTAKATPPAAAKK
jgi:type IV pilus assembly protein PilO